MKAIPRNKPKEPHFMKKSILTLALLVLVTLVFGQEKEMKAKIPQAETFKSTQTVSIKGKTINLATETGTHLLRDENDKPIALFGFTHYRKTNSGKNRPIIFAFNGGPLSASFWLHFGVLGPNGLKSMILRIPNQPLTKW